MNLLGSIITGLLGVLRELAIPLLAYLQGRKDVEAKVVKEQLKEEIKHNEIEETNSVKSDADILNELRSRDTRKER
jgi:hypothetical protein